MSVYADANFFTQAYLIDTTGTLADGMWADIAQRKTPPLPVPALLRAEVTNAFQRLVFESRHGGQWRVTPETAAAAYANFLEDLGNGAPLRSVALAWHDLEPLFETLALRHTAKHGFRTYDVLHVASALALKCDTFWSFDTRARKLAKLEGLKTN